MQKPFFTTGLDSGSERHSAAPDSAKPYLRDILLVFVHGIFSNQRSTWSCTPMAPGGVPEELLSAAGVDVDVLNFYWHSKWYEKADIDIAAQTLLALLKTTDYSAGRYRNVIFVAHSAGGLVVRQVLCMDTPEAREKYSRAVAARAAGGLAALNTVAFRTRAIADLAVPHCGGDRLTTRATLAIYLPVYAVVLAPVFWFVRTATQGGKFWGFYRVALQLQPKNRWISQLRNVYLQTRERLRGDGLPTPARFFASGVRDQVVHEKAEPDVYSHHYADANHSGIKRLFNDVTGGDVTALIHAPPQEFGGAAGQGAQAAEPQPNQTTALAEIVALIRKHTQDPSCHIAERTLERSVNLDMLRGILVLAGPADSDDNAVPNAGGGGSRRGVTQQEAVKIVCEELGRGSPGHVVIIGPAGVGKSLVVRWVLRRLALAFMSSGPLEDPPLPVGYALQGVKLTAAELDGVYLENDRAVDAAEIGSRLLYALLTRWCAWVNREVTYPATVDIGWLWKLVHEGRVTIVFDAVDEFLAMHPRIAPRDVRRMVEYVRTLRATRIVFAFRSALQSQRAFERTAAFPLVVGAERLVIVDRLTKDQARLMFPAVMAELERRLPPDSPLWDLILTPLVLFYLEVAIANGIDDRDLATRTGVLELALKGLLLETLPPEAAADLPLWMDALTVVDWAAFLQVNPDVSKNVVLDEVRARRESWVTLLAKRPPNPEANRFVKSLDMAANESNWELFVRMMFYPTGQERVRMMHQVWRDHLTARYVRSCFEFGHFAELNPLACNRPMASGSAELLVADGFHVTDQTVRTMIEGTRAAPGIFGRGNFCAVIASGTVPISPPAVTVLLAELDSMEPVSRLVVLNGIGARSIYEAVPDESRAALRQGLTAVYRDVLRAYDESRQQDWRNDAVLASTALSHLLVYGDATVIGRAGGILTDSEVHVDHAVSMVADVSRKPPIPTEIYESLQASFLTLVEDLKAPYRAINGLHYLYYLVSAKCRGAQIRRVDEVLPRVFGQSEYQNAVRTAELPYLVGVFVLMKEMWIAAGGAVEDDAAMQHQ